MTPQTPKPSVTDRTYAAAAALLDLNIARKNVQIYPATHEQVRRSLQRAHDRLRPLLEEVSQLELLVAGDGLRLAGRRLDADNPLFAEIARILQQFELVALTLLKGLEAEELLAFLQLLALDPQKTVEEGGLAPLVAQKEWRHIQVRFIDYSLLQVTAEAEISGRASAEEDARLWDAFVAALVADEGAAIVNIGVDPVRVAGLMNQKLIDNTKSVRVFEELFNAPAPVVTAQSAAAPAAARTGMACFEQMLHELTPDLRAPFLGAAWKCLEHSGSVDASQRLIETLGAEMAAQMVRLAKADSKEISPSLLAFIQKVGTLASADTPAAGRRLSTSAVRTLLSREAYEKYIDRQYNRLLKGFSEVQVKLPPSEALARELDSGLSENEINCHIGCALMRLMAMSGDDGGYRDWARQLSIMIEDLARLEEFDCLCDILDFVSQEHQEQVVDERKRFSGLVLERFTDPGIIAYMIAAAQKKGTDDHAARRLMAVLGAPVVTEIVASLSGAETEQELERKLDLMAPFGARAVLEAQKRLDNHPERHVRCMVRVIARFGDSDAVEAVRPLLDHQDPSLRMEALRAVVKHRNPWGLLRLRELMQGAWSAAAEQAVALAGEFKVKEMIACLSAFVARRGPLKVDFERRNAALRALGRIGDTASLPLLKKIALRRGLLGKKHLNLLKRTLFESLEGYPAPQVQGLILLGLEHKDEAIRLVCRRLQQRNQTAAPDLSQKDHDSSATTP